MATEINQFDIALAAISEMERFKDLEIEKLAIRLETEKAELASIRETKRIFLGTRGNTQIDELALSRNAVVESSDRRGTPESWLHPQYKLLGSRKAIKQILEERKAPVEIEDLVEVLYDTKSEDEFKRARNSLSAGLRRGFEEGAWKKLGRSFYAANSVDSTSSAVDRISTTHLGLTQNQDDKPEQEQPTPEGHIQESVV
jgi:hypothetical protein